MQKKKFFIDDDFLLTTKQARELYHGHAEKMPVIDYHCHLPPAELTHRWSFNGDYSDSAGGTDAVKCGTYVSLYGGRVHMGIGHETNGGVTTLEIAKDELPSGKSLTFAVRPLTSLGTSGRPIITYFKV